MRNSTANVAPGALPQQIRKRVGESGFSIIEVLVAMIVLSVGMLGAVGMQAAAMQANKESRNQAMATTFARELAEKMRGNKTVAIQTTATANPYLIDTTLTGTSTVATFTTNCFSSGCPAAIDQASWDIADWEGRVSTALPTPRVKVCFDSDPFTSAGVARWSCVAGGDVAVLKMSWTRSNTAGTLEFASTTGVPLVVVPVTAGSVQ